MVDYVKLKDNDKEEPITRKKKSKISFKLILLIIIGVFILSSIISSISYSLASKIAVVPISGPIMTEKAATIYGDSTSSRDVANILADLEEDTSVKAVLIDINSPGGSPVASEEVSRAIENLKKTKPVYALINDVGASGAFWIAVSADKVYASSMSTVGSIGVTSAGLSFENFIREYNITYRKQTAGKYKDLGSPFREMTPEEQNIIQGILDDIHVMFITHVAASRNMTYDEVAKYATGEIFLGDKAKDLGFIDEIGYYPDVIKALKDKTNSQSAITVNYAPEPSLAQALGIDSIFNLPETKSQILLQ